MLDPKSQRAIDGICEQLRAQFAPRLVTVALYGSAAGADFVAGKSDINLVIVLDRIEYTDLHALRPLLPRWRKNGVATPLVLDREFLRRAADVFPMELQGIRAQHSVLFGENVFASLEVRNQNVRYQCEHEARGKLLRLRGLYLEMGARREELQRLMLDSLKTFLVIMRTLNWMDGFPAPSFEVTLRTFAERFNCKFPVMTHLLKFRSEKGKWEGDTEVTFRGYLEEVQQLVGIVDRFSQPVTSGDEMA